MYNPLPPYGTPGNHRGDKVMTRGKVLNPIVGKQQGKEGAQTESDIYITGSDLERELLTASHYSGQITLIQTHAWQYGSISSF